MTSHQKQLEASLLKVMRELNETEQFSEVRKVYKQNFEEISRRISQLGPRPSVEDLVSYNPAIDKIVMGNFLFFKDVNEAIRLGYLISSHIL